MPSAPISTGHPVGARAIPGAVPGSGAHTPGRDGAKPTGRDSDHVGSAAFLTVPAQLGVPQREICGEGGPFPLAPFDSNR